MLGTRSRTVVVLLPAVLALSLAGVACGGSSSTGPNPTAAMKATIDGVAWQSSAGATIIRLGNDTISVSGADRNGLTLGFSAIAAGPGTFLIAPTEATGAVLLEGSQSWQASDAGGSGSVTFTVLNGTRATGTFQFTVVPFSTGATGTRSVTQGSFDLTF